MVPKDPSITELRISLVFRHCDKRWVKLNEYHYNMVLRGRRSQKNWVRGKRIPLPEREEERDGADEETSPSGSDGEDAPAKRARKSVVHRSSPP